MDTSEHSSSADPFKIRIDVFSDGELRDCDVIPGADDSFMIIYDGVELTSVQHIVDDFERWVQMDDYNMSAELIEDIGGAIENHYDEPNC